MSLKHGMSFPSRRPHTVGSHPRNPPFLRVITNTTCLDEFPSSAAFDVINETLKADEAERKDAISKAKAVVGFNLKNAGGKEESWYLDLKDNGVVGKGAAPEGGKADGEFYILERSI